MVEMVRGSVGHRFQVGEVSIYAGPGGKNHRLPVLAIRGPRDRTDVILADFRNSVSAEKFITALIGAIGGRAPELSEAQAAKVAEFGFDVPPTPEEMIERIRLLGQGKVTFVDEAVGA